MSSDQDSSQLPDWLKESESYEPRADRDAFVSRSLLSMTSVLARMRLDDGASSPFSPSAPVKLVFGLVCILLVSLSRNFAFVLLMLVLVLVRACLLPTRALARVAATAVSAAGLTLLIMLPAVLIGQPRSALTMAGKSLVSCALAMEVALTTPFAELTGALGRFGVPGVVILTVDLALRSIVRLGETAREVLTALALRSVGRNDDKRGSMGGVGGVVLVKASAAARDTHDAMRCRGFEGSYERGSSAALRGIDALWVCLLAALVAAFVYLQGLV